jgi:DNA-binding transcriptional ArsR family regulator
MTTLSEAGHLREASSRAPSPAGLLTSIDDPRYVKAMSHPLRVRILALLDERTASPVELAGWLGAALGTTAYHVRTLERIGLIELVRETRVRGAVEHHYRSKERPSVSDEAWAAAPPIAKQAAVSSSLQTIDAYARAASAAGGFDHGNSHLTRTALHLDARGWNDLSRACMRLLAQVDRIEDAARERMERNPQAGETKDIALVMMLFETARLSEDNGDNPVADQRRRHRQEIPANAD